MHVAISGELTTGAGHPSIQQTGWIRGFSQQRSQSSSGPKRTCVALSSRGFSLYCTGTLLKEAILKIKYGLKIAKHGSF